MRNAKLDIPIDKLRDLELEMACIAKYNVYLHFSDKKAMISTSPECIFDNAYGAKGRDYLVVLSDLIGSNVKESSINHDGDILLLFDCDKEVLIRNLNLNTESYTLELSGRAFVV